MQGKVPIDVLQAPGCVYQALGFPTTFSPMIAHFGGALPKVELNRPVVWKPTIKIKERLSVFSAGELTGDEELEAEGEVDEAAGSLKDKVGDAKKRISDAIDDVKERLTD